MKNANCRGGLAIKEPAAKRREAFAGDVNLDSFRGNAGLTEFLKCQGEKDTASHRNKRTL